jgi:hypothetical protein
MSKSFFSIFTVLIIAALLAGCTTPLPEPVVINPAPTETPILPTSTPRPTSTATLTPIPTVTSTIQVELICEDPQNKLFQDPELYITSPIITSQQAKNAFADISYDEINRELADLVIEIHHAFPWETHLVLPEYVMLRDVEQFMKSRGVEQTYLKLANYVEGMEFNDKNLYLSVHAVNGRWTTSIWKRPIIFLDDKGQYELEGDLMEIVEGEKGINRLYTIPAQNYGTRPEIAIVDGCEPQVVRITPNAEVAAFLSQNADMQDINSVWITNDKVDLQFPGEEVGDFQYKYFLKDNRKGDGKPENYVQPLGKVEFIEAPESSLFTKFARISLAVTKKEISPEGPKIEVGFIWNTSNEERLISYPVELSGFKHDHSEQGKYIQGISYIPEGFMKGGLTCESINKMLSYEQYFDNFEVGEIVIVAIPLEFQDEPAENFEFWGPWFYPTRDRVRELAPSQFDFIEFITYDKKPPDPRKTIIHISGFLIATKSGCNP